MTPVIKQGPTDLHIFAATSAIDDLPELCRNTLLLKILHTWNHSTRGNGTRSFISIG